MLTITGDEKLSIIQMPDTTDQEETGCNSIDITMKHYPNTGLTTSEIRFIGIH